MNVTNLIQIAREKKRNRVLGFFKQAFNDFAYPVYLFDSYATREFHGHSDVNIVDALAKKVYRQACNQMAELGMNYDILIASSINRLDSSIVTTSLQALSATAPCVAITSASMPSNVSFRPNPNSAPPSSRQRGLTLVELMVAMLLGLFLIGGLLQIFISSQQTNRMQESLSRLQENGRFAMDFIIRDIRMTGFLGCAEAVDSTNALNIVFDTIDPVIPNPLNTGIIKGQDAITTNWSPAISPAACSNKCIAGTDAISIRHADSCRGSLKENAPATGDIEISDTNTCGISEEDALIIADCKNADIFRAGKKSSLTVIKHNALSGGYSKLNAELFMYRDHSYFIRSGAGGRPALWMLDNTQAAGGNNPIELVEGISNMHILYGVDTDAEGTANYSVPNYYVPANPFIDWSKVVSVRISLLAATIEQPASKPIPYTWKDTTGKDVTFTPNDRRLRRIFNSTIAVRNRLP